jgi:hypothetical protein
MIAAHTATARSLASRTAGRRSPNLAGAIYGTIIATAVVAGLDEATSVSSGRALAILLGTGLVIWAAQVYASVLAGHIQRHRGLRPNDMSRVIFREWPVFQASLPLAVPLVLGWTGVLGSGTAVGLATLSGVAALIGWGINLARREGYGAGGIAAVATMNAVLGLFIIGLKSAL